MKENIDTLGQPVVLYRGRPDSQRMPDGEMAGRMRLRYFYPGSPPWWDENPYESKRESISGILAKTLHVDEAQMAGLNRVEHYLIGELLEKEVNNTEAARYIALHPEQIREERKDLLVKMAAIMIHKGHVTNNQPSSWQIPENYNQRDISKAQKSVRTDNEWKEHWYEELRGLKVGLTG